MIRQPSSVQDDSSYVRRPSTIHFTTSSVDDSSTARPMSSPPSTISTSQQHSNTHDKQPSDALLSKTTTTEASPSTATTTNPATATATAQGGKAAGTRKLHILLAVTGSVATIKIPLIIGKLQQIYHDKAEIQLMVTASAEHFMKGLKIPSNVKVWKDRDEWDSRLGSSHGAASESVLHVRLRRWADILLIAPLSANTLAKIANGICNNLVTSVIRAWNPATPMLIAPAMNTHMYTNPMTKKHIMLIKEECPWVEVLKPVEKVLVCGDIGMGGMREWTDIVEILVKRLGGANTDDEEDDENDNDNGAFDDEEDEDEEEEEEEDEDQNK